MTFSPSTSRRGFQLSPPVIVALGLLAVVLVTFAACQLTPKAPKDPYRFGAVTRGDLNRTVSASGTLQALITVQVGSQISGQIREVLVDFNTVVHQGDVLAIIDPDTYTSRVQSAQADLGAAAALLSQQQANLKQAEAQLALDKANFDRTQYLANQNIASRQSLDQARATLQRSQAAVDVARAQIGAQRARVVQSQASVRSSSVDLARTRIVSPIDGVVVQRSIDPGQTVAASFQAPVLFLIAQDLSKLQVKIMVDEADIGQVREGQTVSFTVDAFPDQSFQGKVTQVRKQPETSANVVAYVVIAEAENPNGLLLPGMTANADIMIEQRRNVLRVPVAALRFKPADQRAAPTIGFGGPGGGFGGGRPPGGGQGGQGQGGPRMIGMQAFQQLGLSPEQDRQIRALVQDMFKTAMANRGDREAMRVAREEMEKKIDAILTPEQRVKMAAIRAAMAQSRGGTQIGTIYVLKNGKPSPIMVRVGASDGTNTEVTPLVGALAPNTQVIVGGGPQPKAQVRAPIPGMGNGNQQRR